MEFVVHVLESVFNKNSEDAYTIMLHVHQKGVGVCGVFTFEVAETKVERSDGYGQAGRPSASMHIGTSLMSYATN